MGKIKIRAKFEPPLDAKAIDSMTVCTGTNNPQFSRYHATMAMSKKGLQTA